MKWRIMNNTLTKYIFFQIVCQPCTSPMYINHVHKYHTIYHKISPMDCMPITCANCVSSKCSYQYANHVPQTSVISLMICLYQEPSTTIMYLNQWSVSSISSIHQQVHQTCIITCTKKTHQPWTNTTKIWTTIKMCPHACMSYPP